MSHDICNDCDRECRDHGKNNLLLKQHDERLHYVEGNIDILNADTSNTEGRLTSFMWGIGLIFMLIVSTSVYGVLQMNTFKDIYTNNNKSTDAIIATLNRSIAVTNNNVKHIKEDISLLKSEQRIYIHNKMKSDNMKPKKIYNEPILDNDKEIIPKENEK